MQRFCVRGCAPTYAYSRTTCQVNVKFTPLAPGSRRGAVNIYDGSANVLASVPIYGVGSGPEVTYQPGTLTSQGAYTDVGGVAVDASGNLFVTGNGNGTIEELPAGGGAPVYIGSGFQEPWGIAVDGAGNVFLTDLDSGGSFGSGSLFEVLAAGGYTTVKTLATGLFEAHGVAVDGSDNVYVTENGASVATEFLADTGYSIMRFLGSGFISLQSISLDGSENIFVTDTGRGPGANQLFEIVAAGGYTTVKPLGGGFLDLVGVAVDAADNVYVVDGSSGQVEEILAHGNYSAVRVLTTANPVFSAVAADGKGNLYLVTSTPSPVTKLDLGDSPSVVFPTATLANSEDTTDGPQTVGIWNVGNQPLVFTTPESGSNPSYPAGFPENSGDSNLCSAGLSVAVGTHCDVSLNFEPTTVGVLSGSVLLTDNALNVAGATETIPASGTGLAVPTTSKLTATPTTVSAGHPETLTATVTSTSGTATGTVNFLVDGVQTASAALVSGKATATITLAAGTHSITASHPATGPYLASSSSVVTVAAVNAVIGIWRQRTNRRLWGALLIDSHRCTAQHDRAAVRRTNCHVCWNRGDFIQRDGSDQRRWNRIDFRLGGKRRK